MSENTNTERVLAIAEILKQRLSYVDGTFARLTPKITGADRRPVDLIVRKDE